jgi:hypothetical protein
MNDQPPTRPEDAPGHYGAGYGEQVPATTPPRPAPLTDDEAGRAASDAGDAPPVFTPEDVHVRPPDQPPTEDAPASDKAGLIFERS